MRGSPRCFAQRPLPSMITATCRGSEALASALKCGMAELIFLVADYAISADSKMKKTNFRRLEEITLHEFSM
jgi:hypothetical protein